MLQRWLGFLVVRRAWRVLLAEDPRPLGQRLTHEAKRILVAAAVVLVVFLALFVAAIVVAITCLS